MFYVLCVFCVLSSVPIVVLNAVKITYFRQL